MIYRLSAVVKGIRLVQPSNQPGQFHQYVVNGLLTQCVECCSLGKLLTIYLSIHAADDHLYPADHIACQTWSAEQHSLKIFLVIHSVCTKSTQHPWGALQQSKGRYLQHMVFLSQSCTDLCQELDLALLWGGEGLHQSWAVDGESYLWKPSAAANRKTLSLDGWG